MIGGFAGIPASIGDHAACVVVRKIENGYLVTLDHGGKSWFAAKAADVPKRVASLLPRLDPPKPQAIAKAMGDENFVQIAASLGLPVERVKEVMREQLGGGYDPVLDAHKAAEEDIIDADYETRK